MPGQSEDLISGWSGSQSALQGRRTHVTENQTSWASWPIQSHMVVLHRFRGDLTRLVSGDSVLYPHTYPNPEFVLTIHDSGTRWQCCSVMNYRLLAIL